MTHRDIKPDNILLTAEGDALLADFGTASTRPRMHGRAGTASYQAPELRPLRNSPSRSPSSFAPASGSYTSKVDMWSVGVVLYTMLSGNLPFKKFFAQGRWHSEKAAAALGIFDFKSATWSKVSVEAKALVSALLLLDPDARLSAAQALKHAWFASPADAPHSPPTPTAATDCTPHDAVTPGAKGAPAFVTAESAVAPDLPAPAPPCAASIARPAPAPAATVPGDCSRGEGGCAGGEVPIINMFAALQLLQREPTFHSDLPTALTMAVPPAPPATPVDPEAGAEEELRRTLAGAGAEIDARNDDNDGAQHSKVRRVGSPRFVTKRAGGGAGKIVALAKGAAVPLWSSDGVRKRDSNAPSSLRPPLLTRAAST